MNLLINKLRKTQIFADIVDATQLNMHAKIPEKIMEANKDLVSAVADLDKILPLFFN